ncbi:MAG: response regulator [Eubacteriales bacterium]|nr:response regulator [Eubacteriales bacterium]MDD3349336.1 response regulator [Eubacteriales bacterium]
MEKPVILIVDDEPINLSVLSKTLGAFFHVRACKSGEDALRAVNIEPRPELILLDIVMPGMDGYAVLSKLRQDPKTKEIPVIYITALDSIIDEEKGFHLGAVDYITKPFRPAIVVERVRVHLELKQARDFLKDQNTWLEAEVSRRFEENQLVQDVSMSVISGLTETRDFDTGDHILRTQAYVELLGRRLQLNPKYAGRLSDTYLMSIVKAAPLHDVGKIGIPDRILLKPSALTEEEFEIMKKHCQIGGNAIREAINRAILANAGKVRETKLMSLTFLEEAELIAVYHHEKWDGSGYPYGLEGTEIPLSARLMALADVFDALTRVRIYKKPWNIQSAIDYILSQKGLHFDPDIVDAFEDERCAFERILLIMGDAVEEVPLSLSTARLT